jgi:hypothetical protein
MRAGLVRVLDAAGAAVAWLGFALSAGADDLSRGDRETAEAVHRAVMALCERETVRADRATARAVAAESLLRGPWCTVCGRGRVP